MLQLHSIDAGYGSFQALFDISLEVNAGEAVAVIGPNGAGKTTLMRVISGLIRPMRGSMQMEGADLTATPPHRIVELGIAHVPENRRLFPRMTVEDNLRMGGFVPAARPKFRERLDFVYQLFPRLRERRQSACRHAVRRRAADVRHRPRADVGTAPAAARRTVRRPGAGRRAAGVRPGGAHPRQRPYGADRRTERPPGAAVVDRAYLLEAGTLRASGAAGELLQSETIREAYLGV